MNADLYTTVKTAASNFSGTNDFGQANPRTSISMSANVNRVKSITEMESVISHSISRLMKEIKEGKVMDAEYTSVVVIKYNPKKRHVDLLALDEVRTLKPLPWIQREGEKAPITAPTTAPLAAATTLPTITVTAPICHSHSAPIKTAISPATSLYALQAMQLQNLQQQQQLQQLQQQQQQHQEQLRRQLQQSQTLVTPPMTLTPPPPRHRFPLPPSLMCTEPTCRIRRPHGHPPPPRSTPSTPSAPPAPLQPVEAPGAPTKRPAEPVAAPAEESQKRARRKLNL